MPTLTGMIKEFHENFALDYNGPPRELPMDLAIKRIEFINEEFKEYMDAWHAHDLEKQLDSLVDLVYVVLGTAHLHGFNFDEAFKRVHEANMKKERDYDLDSMKSGVYKPEGWEPPFLTDLVRNND